MRTPRPLLARHHPDAIPHAAPLRGDRNFPFVRVLFTFEGLIHTNRTDNARAGRSIYQRHMPETQHNGHTKNERGVAKRPSPSPHSHANPSTDNHRRYPCLADRPPRQKRHRPPRFPITSNPPATMAQRLRSLAHAAGALVKQLRLPGRSTPVSKTLQQALATAECRDAYIAHCLY